MHKQPRLFVKRKSNKNYKNTFLNVMILSFTHDNPFSLSLVLVREYETKSLIERL